MLLDSIFLIAAVVGGTVMVCQFVLTLIGMGHDVGDGVADGGDFHGDAGDVQGGAEAGEVPGDHHTSWSTADGDFVHHDSNWLFGVISFRTLVAGAAFFGIAGKAASSAGFSQPQSLTIAVLTGLAGMYGIYWLMQSIAKLTSSGNERIANALGRRATVYIPIPGNRQGAGKVQLSMQNRIVEFQAMTEEPDRLRTGETVEVVGVVGSDLVQVRRVPQTVEA